MFLELDEQGQVVLKKGAMNIPSVKELYASDKRSESKPYFYKCITLIYHLHKKEHEFSNLGPKERLNNINTIYFKDDDVQKYLDKPLVQAVIKDFINLEYTTTERLYEGIKRSIEHWKLKMADIPMTKKIKYEHNHDTTIEDGEGNPKVITIPVKITIDVDNSEEYLKAMKTANDMIDMEEKIAKKVIKENQARKSSGENTMLEDGNFDHLLSNRKK